MSPYQQKQNSFANQFYNLPDPAFFAYYLQYVPTECETEKREGWRCQQPQTFPLPS